MISGSLAVEGPPRGLGLSVPGHHLTHHPPPSFMTYHHPSTAPTSSSGGVSHPYHHSAITGHHHHPSVVDSATAAAAAWNSMRAAMVTSQHQSTASIVAQSQAQTSNSGVTSSMSQHPSTSQQKQSEFLMPLPKPLSTRYNGGPSSSNLSGSNLNGLRGNNSSSSRSSKYSPPAATVTNASNSGPVNLVQHNKDENISSSGPGGPPSLPPPPTQEELYQSAAAAYARIYVPQNFSYGNLAGTAGPYGPALYPPPYTPIISRSALEQQSYFQPQHVYSNPTNQRPNLERLSSSLQQQSPEIVIKSPKDVNKLVKFQQPSATVTSGETFKVPSGKEGSLKHRILTRPSSGSSSGGICSTSVSDGSDNISVHSKKHSTSSTSVSSPGSKGNSTALTIPHGQITLNINKNSIIPMGFSKDSYIRLGNGELKRVEDMRTEDFVVSAQNCSALRLADSTVVRIQENSRNARITLSYNQNRTQVEIEILLEHPLFIYGQGWASCLPERTLQCYGIKAHRLQVGDICISLMPREHTPPTTPSSQRSITETQHGNSRSVSSKSPTITTTATTTAMTTRQITPKTTVSGGTTTSSSQFMVNQPPRTHSAEEVAAIEASNARKRRWSAPDQICDDDATHTPRRHKE